MSLPRLRERELTARYLFHREQEQDKHRKREGVEEGADPQVAGIAAA